MLWDDFLNSDYHDWRGGGKSEDRLDRAGWLYEWLVKHGLPDPGAPLPEEKEELKRLRSRLFEIVRELAAGRPLPGTAVGALNRELEGGPVVRRLSHREEGIRLETAALNGDWHAIRAEIAASFARMLTEGEPDRLRICENPDCLWVYYDETKNRSKRYCDDKMCGNLLKVRRFRARRKTGEK